MISQTFSPAPGCALPSRVCGIRLLPAQDEAPSRMCVFRRGWWAHGGGSTVQRGAERSAPSPETARQDNTRTPAPGGGGGGLNGT